MTGSGMGGQTGPEQPGGSEWKARIEALPEVVRSNTDRLRELIADFPRGTFIDAAFDPSDGTLVGLWPDLPTISRANTVHGRFTLNRSEDGTTQGVELIQIKADGVPLVLPDVEQTIRQSIENLRDRPDEDIA